MKKRNFQSLTINKKVISNMTFNEIKGGTQQKRNSGVSRCNFSNCACD
ncbi:hypothetical protein H2O64_22775 [Kordia sp. YSTF-M3]|uniref:Bacteriocin n=1 Tax=Kordia aestuariivivens TaxID=2759037 RepID=A0ABR7QG19_9FLAO|nr:hypothetical protein [Kordia aestuariivivens]MBC8757512.1 hypothetical protein [Kordia aestuariivivens]